MKNGITILLTGLACAATNLAAQSTAYVIQTNLPGVTAAAEPPAWLDPLTATDADLATYGFPPRPNAGTKPARLRAWQRAMAHPKRFVVPQLTITNRVHGTVRAMQVVPPQANPEPPVLYNVSTVYQSPNWSAAIALSGASSFGDTSFHTISAEYVVPAAAQPSDCSSGTYYSSSWVGIDGWGSLDVLQAGSESDASCESQEYYAWYEWYSKETGTAQGPEVKIGGGFTVSPGDDIWVEVWNTSSTQGYFYIFNYATGQAVSLSFPPPPGTRLIGNTAEWVIERPTLPNGNLSSLAAYGSEYFSYCEAETYNSAVYTPSSALLVTMCNNDTTCPFPGSMPISYPMLLGSNAIQFQQESTQESLKKVF